ncbi:hypothetical protein ALC57_07533 [Trachymyrmex cornetzi]|uniref:GIY-YIG domain-containing protein n=1 Tax=Trachymyrmex cornetzi TaxID=471704 RepID=A0A151J801_9HYME|nr:hypothetical protein ALC57_07533 [Trachymyrmex cornetzi]
MLILNKDSLIPSSDFSELYLNILTLSVSFDLHTLSNGYPLKMIFDNMNKRTKKLRANGCTEIGENVNDNNNNGEKLRNLIVFPYIKTITSKVTKVINKSKTIIGYRCINKLDRFINTHKDKNEYRDNNNVIYKINCIDCDVSYVGQTKRHLKTRIKEHRNNIKYESKHSVVTKHITDYNHKFNWEKVKILDHETNFKKRLISEMIHIKGQTNGINLIKDTELLDKSYLNIIEDLHESSGKYL